MIHWDSEAVAFLFGVGAKRSWSVLAAEIWTSVGLSKKTGFDPKKRGVPECDGNAPTR